MKKLTEAEVNTQNPWEDDKLGRDQVALRLSKLLETTEGPLVVSVSASYGMGKTFFSKRWCIDLERQGKFSIYFNAWETDFADNPLLPLLSAITEKIEDLGFSSSEQQTILKKVESTIKAAAPTLLRTTLKMGIRAATFGATDGKIDNIWEAMAEGGLEDVEKFATTQLDVFATEKKARISFKQRLVELRDIILAARENNKDNSEIHEDKKIYIFIDELDRCRPPYALEFLEAIKHLFDVPGFVFILCVDELALQASAAQIYGTPENGEGYLRKSIDYRFRLPAPENTAMAEHLFDTYGLSEIVPESPQNRSHSKEITIDSFAFWAQQLGASLRVQSQAFALMDIVVRSYGITVMPILASLCCLRESNPQIWHQLASTNDSWEIAKEALGYNPSATQTDDFESWRFSGYLRLFYSDKPLPNEPDKDSIESIAFNIRSSLSWDYHFGDYNKPTGFVKERVKEIELMAKMHA